MYSFLKAISSSITPKPLSHGLWRCLVDHGIANSMPTRRECRAGRLKLRAIATTSSVQLEGNANTQVQDKQDILRGKLNIQFDASANSAFVRNQSTWVCSLADSVLVGEGYGIPR